LGTVADPKDEQIGGKSVISETMFRPEPLAEDLPMRRDVRTEAGMQGLERMKTLVARRLVVGARIQGGAFQADVAAVHLLGEDQLPLKQSGDIRHDQVVRADARRPRQMEGTRILFAHGLGRRKR
jgi:hypothetical protein